MIKKKLTRLIGIKYEDFKAFVKSNQILAQEARLIPTLKTGDEMALTSIFLASINLVKEYRDYIFKELKLSRGGKAYFFREVTFPDIDKESTPDGLIIIVSKGIIKDACLLEMKNKDKPVEKNQIEKYIELAKKLGVGTIVTVSNEFVANSSLSPINIRVPKSISLYHFSWTYLMTVGQLLLFDNEENIYDNDQSHIMEEVLYYMDSPISGVSGYHQMQKGWKDVAESIRDNRNLKASDKMVEEAVLSWYEEEKDMALLLSRKLGVLVKSSAKGKDSIKLDSNQLVKSNHLTGSLSVKNSVSDIKIGIDFERRSVTMSVKINPPLDKGTVGRISWMSRQLDNCKKKTESQFLKIEKDLRLEGNVKFAKSNIQVKLSELDQLQDETKAKEIQAFHVLMIKGFGAQFTSQKKFVQLIEQMVIDYYAGIVQHLVNWSRHAPKLVN